MTQTLSSRNQNLQMSYFVNEVVLGASTKTGPALDEGAEGFSECPHP